MSSREKKSWEWGRKQRESGRALRGSSVAQGDPLPVSGIAAGRERYGRRGCRESIYERGGAYAGGSECERGVCAWSIIRNSFGYVAISIVLNRKTSFYVIAEKWLKRNYIMSGRDWEGERRGVKGCGSEMLGESVGVYASGGRYCGV